MKNIKIIRYGLGAVLLITAIALGMANAGAASSVNVAYSFSPNIPSGTSISNGQNLVVDVYEDSGSDTINTVEPYITYPTASLSYVSIDYSASQFSGGSSGHETDNGAGTISLTRVYFVNPPGCTSGCTYGVTGKQLIASIHFTVTGSYGSVPLAFSNGQSNAYTPPTTPGDPSTVQTANISSAGLTYNLPAAPTGGSGGTNPSPSPSPSKSTSKSSSSPSSSAKPVNSSTAYTSDSGKLTISGISSSNLGATSATINWTTNVAATSEVDYGTDAGNLAATNSDSGYLTSHSVKLDSSNLKADTIFYFKVKSADKSGNIVSSDTLYFHTATGSGSSGSAKSKSSSKVPVIAGAVGAAALSLGVLLFLSKRLHQRILMNKELQSHIVAQPPPPPANASNVVTPQPGADKNPPGPKVG